MNLEIKNKQNELLEVIEEGCPIAEANKILVMTHGFGTNLHERGLNDEIVTYLLRNNHHLCIIRFSWSGFGESEGKQSKTSPLKIKDDLVSVLDYVFEKRNKFSKVITFAFSMGNIALARAVAENNFDIELIINANPAAFKKQEEIKRKWAERPGSYIDEHDVMHIPRADGTVTLIGEVFWSDFGKFSYKDDINLSIKKTKSVLLRATDDDVVNNNELAKLPFAEIISIHGDHNFSKPEHRKIFLETLNNLLLERNTVVDKDDNVIGSKIRSEITHEDIYRVAGLWLYNQNGQVLLAQRAFTKSHDPGKWGPSVAGTVAEGEDYLTTIIRETEEELGLTGLEFELGPKIYRSEGWKYWSQKFYATTDKDISDMKIQKDEVESVKWFDEDKLAKMIEEKPEIFIPSMKSYYKK